MEFPESARKDRRCSEWDKLAAHQRFAGRREAKTERLKPVLLAWSSRQKQCHEAGAKNNHFELDGVLMEAVELREERAAGRSRFDRAHLKAERVHAGDHAVLGNHRRDNHQENEQRRGAS